MATTTFSKVTGKLAEERERRFQEEEERLKQEQLRRRKELKLQALERRRQLREEFANAKVEAAALREAEEMRCREAADVEAAEAEHKARAAVVNRERCTKLQRQAQTLLQATAEGGRELKVAQLVASGRNVNAQEPGTGWTPLHWAVHNNDSAALKLLLRAKANPNIREYHHGDIPINLACTLPRMEMVQALVSAKSWLQHVNRHGQTLLVAAGKAGHPGVVELLLQLGVHKQTPAPTGVHLEYLGTKTDGATRRTEKTLLSQLYPAVQEYDGSYNKIPETASERYARKEREKNLVMYGPDTQPHPGKWKQPGGPRPKGQRP